MTRGTTILANAVDGTTETEWEITDSNSNVFFVNSSSASNYSNIFSASISSLNIWLPPNHEFLVRTRHKVDDVWTSWSIFETIESTGYQNSYENYLSLTDGVQEVATDIDLKWV